MSPSTGWDVLDTALQALATVTGDQLAWAAAITAGPRPTENPFTPSGHLDDAGQPSPLTAAHATPLHAAASQVVEPLRGFAYAPALAPLPGDDEIVRLLRYLGRQPCWKPAE